MNYKGVVIEESLKDKKILKDFSILETKVERVTEQHKTPWLNKWTLHTVEVPEEKAGLIAQKISKYIDREWYADFKNDKFHFIIFRNKVFLINRKKKEGYDKAILYGLSLGIPDYQLDFSPAFQ